MKHVALADAAGKWFHVLAAYNPTSAEGRVWINGELKITRNYVRPPETEWYFKNGVYNTSGSSKAHFKNIRFWEVAAAGAGQRLQFRLVAEPGDAGDSEELVDPSVAGGKLRLLKPVALDERDLREVSGGVAANGQRVISLTFTDEGGRKFSALTGEHIGRRLAIVFDGRVLCSPRINSEIGAKAEISGGGAGGLDEKERDGLVRAMSEAAKDAQQPPRDHGSGK